MKQMKFLFVSAMFLGMANVHAADVLTVENVTLPQNGEVELEIKAQLETNFTQFQMEIVLDEGLGMAFNKSNRPWAELGDTESTDHTVSSSTPAAHTFRFVINSMNQMRLPDSEVLLRVKIVPDGTSEVGTVLHGIINNIVFSERTASGTNVGHDFEDIPFTVTIGDPIDPRTLLDENATVAPTDATGVDIRVKRTIKANEWSTICLPFAMTEEQVKAAFGEDVQIGDFNDYDYDDVTDAMSVAFINVTATEANHPYIIKVTDNVTSFTADGVTIDPQDAVIDFDTDRRHRYPRKFVGTYVANTELDWGMMFLSGNQFWYSVGNTKMKAFRAYFNFYDVLASFEDTYSSRITMTFDNTTTGIHDNKRETINDKRCYDLQGRRLSESGIHNSELRKGLYIVNGKKVVKK